MSAPSGLDPDRELGEALRAVALSILDEARAALSTADRDRSTAIHDFRKEMKRWRALLRLMTAFLGGDCRHLRQTAGDLARSFTAARDVQSAIMILPALAKPAPDAAESLSPHSFNTIKERLEDLRGKSEQITLDGRKFQLLSDYITAASERVNEWQLDDISFGALAREIAKTYRRARRAMPADWTAASPEELHEFRRRVIEHRYQMELIERAWPRLVRLWIDEAQRLRTRLGNFQDLAVLKRLMEPHQPLSHWQARLTPLVEARQASYVKGAARIAMRLFAESPKAFRRRIEALWESQADR
jgi:CHAD domain-containing protein